MKLRDILATKGSKVWAVKGGQKIQEALAILLQQRIGALLVLDPAGAIEGIISERDIVRACVQHPEGLNQVKVQDLMTKEVITSSPDESISAIMAVMTSRRIRHIPVLSGNRLEGIVSIGDVVKALLEDSETQIRSLKEYLYGSAQ